jgi:hypothetical protein
MSYECVLCLDANEAGILLNSEYSGFLHTGTELLFEYKYCGRDVGFTAIFAMEYFSSLLISLNWTTV